MPARICICVSSVLALSGCLFVHQHQPIHSVFQQQPDDPAGTVSRPDRPALISRFQDPLRHGEDHLMVQIRDFRDDEATGERFFKTMLRATWFAAYPSWAMFARIFVTYFVPFGYGMITETCFLAISIF